MALDKLSKRNPGLSQATFKKIEQIVNQFDEFTIDHFKNLKHCMSDYKRVHIGSFILTFNVDKQNNFIEFVKLEHHDYAYGRKK